MRRDRGGPIPARSSASAACAPVAVRNMAALRRVFVNSIVVSSKISSARGYGENRSWPMRGPMVKKRVDVLHAAGQVSWSYSLLPVKSSTKQRRFFRQPAFGSGYAELGSIQRPGDPESDVVETASGIDPHTIREARV